MAGQNEEAKLFVAGLPDSVSEDVLKTDLRGYWRQGRQRQPPERSHDGSSARLWIRDDVDPCGSAGGARFARWIAARGSFDLRAAIPAGASPRGRARRRSRADHADRGPRPRRPGPVARSGRTPRGGHHRKRPIARSTSATCRTTARSQEVETLINGVLRRRQRRARSPADGSRRSQARLRLRHDVELRDGEDRGRSSSRPPTCAVVVSSSTSLTRRATALPAAAMRAAAAVATAAAVAAVTAAAAAAAVAASVRPCLRAVARRSTAIDVARAKRRRRRRSAEGGTAASRPTRTTAGDKRDWGDDKE